MEEFWSFESFDNQDGPTLLVITVPSVVVIIIPVPVPVPVPVDDAGTVTVVATDPDTDTDPGCISVADIDSVTIDEMAVPDPEAEGEITLKRI